MPMLTATHVLHFHGALCCASDVTSAGPPSLDNQESVRGEQAVTGSQEVEGETTYMY